MQHRAQVALETLRRRGHPAFALFRPVSLNSSQLPLRERQAQRQPQEGGSKCPPPPALEGIQGKGAGQDTRPADPHP